MQIIDLIKPASISVRPSVSFVLLWQPSECIDLFGIDCIFVSFSGNKYDDDDEQKLRV